MFWPLRLMLPPAETPRLAIVIALEPDTAPEVRSAKVEKLDGLSALETVMFPLLLPPLSPIRSVAVVTLANSVEVRDRLPAVSVPRFIAVLAVVGVNVTTPLVALIEFAVLMASESARINT